MQYTCRRISVLQVQDESHINVGWVERWIVSNSISIYLLRYAASLLLYSISDESLVSREIWCRHQAVVKVIVDVPQLKVVVLLTRPELRHLFVAMGTR